ncbi:ABC transporter substrate-binding protein [Microlunatus antarcticus]|uniref:Multiple sugar transport system substrate-binding protein n=1 Tax=Microlunatus antarcticus TaxID=53388 RepID=A0A7W5P836_9ACTN|nr:sugar ABC transporter substrate-binding protein [Microlunatus antarcticus]MBB3327531.1 multiple sugar transport system substrate-binding protein [Microlunatus antarcticus]
MARRTTWKAALVGAAVLSLALTACGGGSGGSDGGSDTGADGGALDTTTATGEISYWLWENAQQPAYQSCADLFQQQNPGTKINISQYAWDDYWNKLTTSFVANSAPDVFTDHLSKYGEFVSQDQLVPLDATLAKDGFDVNQYQPGLADLWVGQDGKRYGLPKDFDTVSLFYNSKFTEAAGVTADQLRTMVWNPTDGGTYEKVIAHLTVDENGKRGDEAGFDKSRVKVYGLGLDGGSGAGVGQTQWSMYTGSNGWQFTDKNPWGTHYNYDQPQFQDTIAWVARLIDKGYMPSVAAVTGQSAPDIFAAGKYAMVADGSWTLKGFYASESVEVATAPTPVGPSGRNASMYNGLADSIWVGSKNKPLAAKWVEFLGSPACQDIVGADAVVFPAIPSGTDKAEAAWKAKGIDITSFTSHLDNQTTFLFPITDHASEITNVMQAAMDDVLSGKKPASSLTEANTQVNQLFQ